MATKDHLTNPLKPARIFSLGVAATIIMATPLQLAAAPTPEPKSDQQESVKTAFPTLDILPEGSILRRVRLPRYDKDFVSISLLTAETLTVLDKERIDGLGITIRLYAKDGSTDVRTKMRHAIYNQKLSTLHASEAVLIQGKSYIANGTGMVFDWKSNRGLLLGPVRTKFTRTTPNKSTTMQFTPLHPSLSTAKSLIALTGMSTSLMATPPAKLTPAQIAEFEHLSQPMKEHIEQQQQQTRRILNEDDRLNTKADSDMGPFLKSIGQASLLVQTPAAPKKDAATPIAADQKVPGAKPPIVETLKVTCDGGLYFDTDTGILAYLKNVRLTEPRFTLTCTDELKVFLDKKPDENPAPKKPSEKAGEKPADPAATAEAPKQAPAAPKKEDAKKDDGMGNFGNIKRISATGKVKVTRKDDKGKLFIATAEKASYDGKTGEMILRGGLPRLQLGPNEYLQALAPGQYIRILGNGKFITEGKWEMKKIVKADKPKKKPAAKKKTTTKKPASR